MGFKKYVKRLLKYVLYEHKQDIVYAKIYQKKSDEILKDKVILVTGGGRGLGFYIAKKLVNDGAYVIITGRNEEILKKAKNEIGDNCEYKVLDVMSLEDGEIIIKEIFDEFGRLDCLINNAGISLHEKDMLDVSIDKFEQQFNTNLKAPYFLSQFYIREYLNRKQKNGNIIFISSERGSQCDYLPYGLTKVAINSLTQCLGKKYYKSGIRVNAIAPGVTASDMTKIDKSKDLYSDRTTGRYFVPEEVAEIVSYFVSDYSKCISGEIINCDGGGYANSYFDVIK